MKSIALLLSCAAVASAQNITTVTTIVIPGSVTNSAGGLDCYRGTNTVTIANGEAARVATLNTEDAYFVKNGVQFIATRGNVVAGPCTFTVWSECGEPALLTLERWKVKREPVAK